jgi:hypothetical protein
MPIFEDNGYSVVIPAQAGIHHVLQGVTNVVCGISQDVMDPSLRGDDGVF